MAGFTGQNLVILERKNKGIWGAVRVTSELNPWRRSGGRWHSGTAGSGEFRRRRGGRERGISAMDQGGRRLRARGLAPPPGDARKKEGIEGDGFWRRRWERGKEGARLRGRWGSRARFRSVRWAGWMGLSGRLGWASLFPLQLSFLHNFYRIGKKLRRKEWKGRSGIPTRDIFFSRQKNIEN